ncbi:hypothetical protein BYT27DRAFT_7190842, partial [Phlegmacium glaucopus]
ILDSRSSLIEGGSLALSHLVFLVFPLAHLPRFLRTPRDLLGMSLLKSENAVKNGVFLE